jgi:hypothetical protein
MSDLVTKEEFLAAQQGTAQALNQIVQQLQERTKLMEQFAEALGWEYSQDAKCWVVKTTLDAFRENVRKK